LRVPWLLLLLFCAAPAFVVAVAPPPSPPAAPPVGVVGGVDYCALAVAAMNNATAAGGSCAACPAIQGGASGCAAACPGCMNALNAYLTSCATNFAALNYGTLQNYATVLNAGKACFHLLNRASNAYAVLYCGSAFDYVVSYSETAMRAGVVVAGGGMATPYPCAAANASFCSADCQADLNLLAQACHAEDTVQWEGKGMPGFMNATGAPNGTAFSPLVAFKLFVNGSAAVPRNLAAGLNSSMAARPLNLAACAGNNSGVYPHYPPPPPRP
jgi:hypothetical protein